MKCLKEFCRIQTNKADSNKAELFEGSFFWGVNLTALLHISRKGNLISI